MDKISKNRKIALAAERSAAEANRAAAAPTDQSTVGKAISTANTALAVHAEVMGAYGKVMGATGALAEKAVQEFSASVVGVTLSTEQLKWANDRLAKAGLAGSADLRLQDYRDIGKTGELA